MAFRNALKLLISVFGMVWTLLIYSAIVITIITLISMPFLAHVFQTFKDAQIDTYFYDLFNMIINGENIYIVYDQLDLVARSVVQVLSVDVSALVGSTVFVVIIVGIIYRFIIGLYEIPVMSVLNAKMSSNASISFVSQFISQISYSIKFSLTRILYTLPLDIIMVVVLFQISRLFHVDYLRALAPFAIMLFVLLYQAARFAFVCAWTPYIVVENNLVSHGLKKALNFSFRNYARLFSVFLMTWLFVIVINLFVGVITFGAGLLLTLPVSVIFINVLNMTIFYNKTQRRYYLEESIFTPPVLE